MWIKVWGALLVVGTSTYIGFRLAWRCRERPHQIRQVISCIVSLKSYINYAALPLSEALISCAQGINGVIANFFEIVSGYIQQGNMSPQNAINIAIEQVKHKWALDKPEVELITVLGANLGSMNRDEQHKFLCMIQEQLVIIEKAALLKSDQTIRMYRYLGVCSGLAIVILLI